MTRRLTRALLGTVAAALLLAGVGTLVLARAGAREETRRQVEAQVADVAGVAEVAPRLESRRLAGLARALDLEGFAIVRLGPGGRALDRLPAGVRIQDLDLDRLRAGDVVSGANGSIVFAARGVTEGPALTVAIATRGVDLVLGTAARWFLVAAVVTLVVAAIVARRLARRLTGPLRSADTATRRIAAGDLAARVDVPAGEDELADLARSVNAMAAALERARGLEHQFLLSVSHDLRTPLTSIRGYAEALADGAAPDPGPAARVILAESGRLERLVGDLLELAKLDARRFSLALGPVDAARVVADAALAMVPSAEEAGLRLDVDVHGPTMVRADPDRLAQVVANLVENAITHASSALALTVTRGDALVTVTVDDDGPGIGPHHGSQVFERQWSSPGRPARRQAGSGLGLAIVAELVGAMGGSVDAGPSPQGGARLTVRLPAVTDTAPPSPTAPT